MQGSRRLHDGVGSGCESDPAIPRIQTELPAKAGSSVLRIIRFGADGAAAVWR